MKTIGKFRVLRELGAGGFGAVYLCRDPFLDRDVAIKVFQVRDDNIARLAVSESTDAGTILKSRFVDEARILRDLGTSPYIVPVFDFDETADGVPYYVMPYLSDNLVGLIGKDAMDPAVVAELPKSERPRKLPLGRVKIILGQLLQALKEVHAARLVHRDIKPANILFNDKEEVQLCDFGIAKLPEGSWSQSGVALGSRDYMSPEQRESAKHVDARSDIYSVGVLAYRMLTGELPIGRYKDPIDHVAVIGKKLNAFIIDCLNQRRDGRPRNGADALARFEASVPDGEVLDDPDATEVGAGPKQRPEAVSLGKEIEAVLLEHGRFPDGEEERLRTKGRVFALSEAGFDALVNDIRQRHTAKLGPLERFLSEVDKAKAKHGATPPKATRRALDEAGLAAGWDAGKVQEVLDEAFSKVPPTAKQKKAPASSPYTSTPLEKPRRRGLWIALAVIVLVVGAGFGLKSWRDYDEGQRRMAESWASVREARDVGLLSGFIETYPDSPMVSEARRRLSMAQDAERKQAERKRKEKAARAEAERKRQEAARLAEAKRKEEVARLAKARRQAAAKQAVSPGKRFKDCSTCPEMVVVPAGSFRMGDLNGGGDDDEKPVHRVTIPKAFAVGRYEVTQGQWRAVMGGNPSGFKGDNRPVEKVSWDDAKNFIRKLNARTGKKYRLLTESEWEYAARAGTTTKYPWGNEASHEYANYGKDKCCGGLASGRDRWENTSPVGSFRPNAFGLYDMHGNVWEWVEDCYKDSYNGAPSNGNAVIGNNSCYRVHRGGSWLIYPRFLRSAIRYRNSPDLRYNYLGFRLARTL